jgi:hypothetical protein
MEVTFILKKLREIEKLKMILFDEDQRKVFEYLPKQTIFKNELKIEPA